MMKQMTLIVMTAVLLVPLTLHAGLFGWLGNKEGGEPSEALASNVVKRLHLDLFDKTAEKELLQYIGAKRILFEERRVLTMLLDEKRRDITNLEGELEKTFGMKRDRNYRYDAKSMAIYELSDKNPGTTNAPAPASGERVVKKLDSESDSRKFASLAAAKQVTHEDIIVLNRLAREKMTALARVENSLMEKFSMSRDRNYWYDPKTMRLYELVNASPKGAVQ
jgi:hypothetical protein